MLLQSRELLSQYNSYDSPFPHLARQGPFWGAWIEQK